MFFKIQQWWVYVGAPTIARRAEIVLRWIVWNVLPYEVRYWCVMRAWADATQGEWSHVDATKVTVEEALDRMT